MNAITPLDSSSIVALVDRARSLFDEGDILNARLMAGAAYDQAAQAVRLAEKVQASEQLLEKSRRMQLDALMIETQCKIRIADLWDEAQASGATSKGGRPTKKPVPTENGFSASDAGLSRKEIFEARKLRDAEAAQPGLVERAIQARIDAGFAPTRRDVRHAIGTKTASKEERGDNLYQTPIEGIRTLMARERFLPVVLEPSCGRGAISGPMGEAGYDVVLSDLNDYATTDKHGELQHVADFLSLTRETVLEWTGGDDFDLVTNPPYGDVLNSYIAHALKRIKPRKMALLLNLNFLCGIVDPDRNHALDEARPARVIINARRLPMMHRDGWDGKEASSQMNTMWAVWERNEEGRYNGPTVMERADYNAYATGPVMSPLGWADVVRAGEIPIDDDDEDFTRTTPRVAIEDRVAEFRDQAEAFAAARDGVTVVELRKALSVRGLLAEALMADLIERGLVTAPDGEGRHFPAIPFAREPEPERVDDQGYAAALALVRETGKASAAMLQRRMQIRWYTANAYVERMEREGLVSAKNAAGLREVLA